MNEPSRRANFFIFMLSIVGICVAGYLWYLHATHTDVPCGASHGCEIVAESKYARFPVGTGPWVAAWGTMGYVAFAVLAFLRTQATSPARSHLLLNLIALGAVAGTLFSLNLTYIELFVIHAICKWCVASQILIAVIAILSVTEWIQLRLLRNRPEEVPS